MGGLENYAEYKELDAGISHQKWGDFGFWIFDFRVE